MPRMAKVTLNGEGVEIRELRVRENEEWLEQVEGPAREVMDLIAAAMATDYNAVGDVTPLIGRATELLRGGMGTVADLMIDFAPYAEEQIDNAYVSELVPAFMEVIKLALPFDQVLSAAERIGSIQSAG